MVQSTGEVDIILETFVIVSVGGSARRFVYQAKIFFLFINFWYLQTLIEKCFIVGYYTLLTFEYI